MAAEKSTNKMEEAPAPAPVTTPTGGTNGLAIAAMVVGIVGFIFGWAPFFGFIAGIAAVILGIIALKKSPVLKGMSITGIVLGGIATLWGLVVSALLIISLVTIGIGGAAATNVLSEANKSITAYEAANQKLIDQKKDFTKGSTATFGNLEVKVNGVTRNYSSESDYITPDTGKEYVVVNVTVKNVGTSSENVSSYDFKINDNGVSNGTSFYDVDPAFDSGDLSSGASMTGNLLYEVSAGSSNLKLQYETTIYGTSAGTKTLTYTLAL